MGCIAIVIITSRPVLHGARREIATRAVRFNRPAPGVHGGAQLPSSQATCEPILTPKNRDGRSAMLSNRMRGGRFKAAAGFVSLIASLMLVSPSAQGADMSGAFVELPNAQLWATDTGGTGDPVILLHANTGTSEAWQKQLPVLVQAGYRAIAFDRPGRGKSVAHDGMKPISVTETLDALVGHLKLCKIHLIGVAGGGYVALDYAAWRPERLKSLVLAATGLGLALDEEALTF